MARLRLEAQSGLALRCDVLEQEIMEKQLPASS